MRTTSDGDQRIALSKRAGDGNGYGGASPFAGDAPPRTHDTPWGDAPGWRGQDIWVRSVAEVVPLVVEIEVAVPRLAPAVK